MRIGRLAVAELSETIDLDKIVAGLPNRIHQIADSYLTKFPDRVALLEDGASATSTGKILKHKLAESLHGA